MVRTVQTLLHSQLACNEMQASARTCGRQHDRKCRLKSSHVNSIYFNHPSQGNSTNYYLILGLRDKAASSTIQQINKFPPKRVKNLVTPSSMFVFVFSSFTGELCSQPIRGNDRPIGRMFPEHVERRFLDPEYSFDEYFQLGSRRNIRPIKNGLRERLADILTGYKDDVRSSYKIHHSNWNRNYMNNSHKIKIHIRINHSHKKHCSH